MQFVTSLSLIAVLLACPQVCRWQSQTAAAEAGESRSVPICSCCRPIPDQAPSREMPSDQGAPPVDCICKGAVCAVADTPTIEIEEATGWLIASATSSGVATANL